jgi:protein-S-isoprenylcysteine O-methyltransferase Ste14
MILRIGNFLFRYRNGLFPAVYLLLVFPSRGWAADYRLAALVGLLVAATGQLLRVVTVGLEYIIRGGRKRQVYAEQLVQGGLYAYCRNPLYVGNAWILLGVGLASNSWLFLGVALPFFAFAYWAIIAAEENYLRQKFGLQFDEYCQRVPRFLPRFLTEAQPLGLPHFNWRRVITAEYGSAFIWIAGILLVTLRNAWLDGRLRTDRTLVKVLLASLAVATLGYGVARFLKKSGLLTNYRRAAH